MIPSRVCGRDVQQVGRPPAPAFSFSLPPLGGPSLLDPVSAREEKASQTLRQLQKEIKAEKAERERQEVAEAEQRLLEVRHQAEEDVREAEGKALAAEGRVEAARKAVSGTQRQPPAAGSLS